MENEKHNHHSQGSAPKICVRLAKWLLKELNINVRKNRCQNAFNQHNFQRGHVSLPGNWWSPEKTNCQPSLFDFFLLVFGHKVSVQVHRHPRDPWEVSWRAVWAIMILFHGSSHALENVYLFPSTVGEKKKKRSYCLTISITLWALQSTLVLCTIGILKSIVLGAPASPLILFSALLVTGLEYLPSTSNLKMWRLWGTRQEGGIIAKWIWGEHSSKTSDHW